MIKMSVKWILGVFFSRYRQPWRKGFIKVKDDVSRTTLMLLWRPDSFMETEFFRYGLYGRWERHSLRIWAHVSTGVHEVLDIGANTGIYSLLARKHSPQATIVAIEPIPTNADVLQANIAANEAHVIVERSAMSDHDGRAEMYMLENRLNYMTAINNNRYAQHPEIASKSKVVSTTVPVITWASLQAKCFLSGPDLIKIDVEGHEVEVLRSLHSEIARRLPTILVEIISSDNAATINAMLRGLNYVFVAIDEDARRAVVVDSLWDNNHQNFLICQPAVTYGLVSKGLMEFTA